MAFVSQSGALSSFILAAAADAGIGFTYWVSTGNEGVLGWADFVDFVLEDPRTRVVMSYLEDARDGNAFKECARKALVMDKPLVILKAGVTAAGAQASVSHTGALVGSRAVYEAVFRQFGILQVNNLEELFDFARLCATSRRSGGNRVAVLTISGGAGVIMADVCEEEELILATYSPETLNRLREIIPAFVSLVSGANPLDLTAQVLSRPEAIYSAQGCTKFASGSSAMSDGI